MLSYRYTHMKNKHSEATIQEKLSARETHQQVLGNLAMRGLTLEADVAPRCEFHGQKFHLISPTSRIEGGFITDVGSSTAVIVDVEKDQALRSFYALITPAFETIANPETRDMGLKGLASVITDRFMPYDEAAVLDKYRHDQQMHSKALTSRYLGEFITDQGGICVQQALLTASALEYAVKSGHLPESFSAHVEAIRNYETGESHAYATLATDTETWIVDPTEPLREHRAFIRNNARSSARHDTTSSP